jgi:hypothetical protein
MVMDQTTTARRPVNGGMDFVVPAPKQRLSAVIEEQRLSLLNVMGIVHCIGMGVANGEKDPPAPEIATAFELLECEIQRIATALEKISLRCATREIATSARLEVRQPKQGHA